MARRKPAAIPPAPRKTLLEWIEDDDGLTTHTAPPPCSKAVRELHARVGSSADGKATEPLAPPPGLFLAPLG